MPRNRMSCAWAVAVAIVLAAGASVTGSAAAPAPDQKAADQKHPVNDDAQVLAEFTKRVADYVALHKKLEATIPSLPREATPQQLDQHERALGKLIRDARRNAKHGDLFTPETQAVIRRLMSRIFQGPDGRQLKRSILDEYTGSAPLRVNAQYPDAVPLSTVPTQVLETLPKVPDELEYRFIGESLILLDTHAHIIADYIGHVFP